MISRLTTTLKKTFNRFRFPLSGLTVAQRLTLGISSMALVVSFITGYYQFLYNRTALSLSIPAYSFDQGTREFEFTFVFVNTGTTPVAVTSIEMHHSKGAHQGETLFDNSDGFAPFAISKGDVVIKRIHAKVPPGSLKELRDPDQLPQILSFFIDTIDSTGLVHETSQKVGRIQQVGDSCSVTTTIAGEGLDLFRDNDVTAQRLDGFFETIPFFKVSGSCSEPAASGSVMVIPFAAGTPEAPASKFGRGRWPSAAR